MLLPRHTSELAGRRDSTDLKVDPHEESYLYREYAEKFGYFIVFNDYEPRNLDENATAIISQLGMANIHKPPKYAGPQDAEIIFVGEARSGAKTSVVPGSWLPFTSHLSTEVGRRIGPNALRCGWTNVGDVPLAFLANKYVIACGDAAAKWLDNSEIVRLVIPHPAWLYRFNDAEVCKKRDLVDQILITIGENNA
jgi:hypothetical protein